VATLEEILAAERPHILRRWLDVVLALHAPETARFLEDERDPFANPVGEIMRQATVVLYDRLCQPTTSAACPPLEQLMRLRAVHESTPSRAVEFLLALKRKDIDWNEYTRLSQLLTQTSAIAAQVTSSAAVKHADKRLPDIQVFGTTANYPQLFNVDLAAGRYFLDAEARSAQALVVIGWDVKDELFPHVDPIGREITVDGRPARVIGVAAQQGRTLGQNQDNRLYAPIQVHRQWFGSRESLDLLLRAAPSDDHLAEAVRVARLIMKCRLD